MINQWQRAAEIQQHLVSARELLPGSYLGPPKWQASAVEKLLDNTLTPAPHRSVEYTLGELARGFHILEILGELNQCPPQFLQHLSEVASLMRDTIDADIEQHLVLADRMLQMLSAEAATSIGSELDGGIVVSATRPIETLHRWSAYERLSTEQQERYSVILKQFREVASRISPEASKISQPARDEFLEVVEKIRHSEF